jgi:hypothetical protein
VNSKTGLIGAAAATLSALAILMVLQSFKTESETTARAVSDELRKAAEPVGDQQKADIPTPDPDVGKTIGAPQPIESVRKDPSAQPSTRTTPVERPPRKLVLREIQAPLGTHSKPENWGKAGEHLFVNVYLNPDVTRIITVADKEAICWDTASGKPVQVFPSPMQSRQNYIAPDARTYVELRSDSKATTTVRSTETGQVIGTYLVKKPSLHGCSEKPGFTPGGDWFVFCERKGHYDRYYSTFHAVSTRTGQGRVLTTKITTGDEDYSLNHLYLHAVPNEPTLLMYFPDTLGGLVPARVCAFDTRTGSVTGFPAVTAKPRDLCNTPGFGMKLSVDGTKLMSLDLWGDLQVCDARSGRLVGEVKKPRNQWSRLDAVLTPDGLRLVTLNQPTPGHRNWFYLHDLATAAELDGFDSIQLGLPENIEAKRLDISRDGKTLAVMFPYKVLLVDFEAAFGTRPLPPVKVGPEVLP